MYVNVCILNTSSVPRISLLLGFLLLFFTSNISSQERKSNRKFVHYSTSIGLSSRNQINIVQDKDGFIWIGTSDGLNRFDGYEFKVYRNIPGDSTSIGSNEVAVFVDSHGSLWASTYVGLYRYNKEHDNFLNIRKNDNTNFVTTTCLVEDKFQRIWIGSHFGLSLYDLNKRQITKTFYFEPQNLEHTIAAFQIRSLTADGENVWIGYGSGVFSKVNMETMQFKHYKLPGTDSRRMADNFINSLCANNDSLWISTWGQGVWIFNKKDQSLRPFKALKSTLVNSISKDRQNNIWIGTETEGLVYYDVKKNTTTFFVHNNNNSNSLSDNCVSNVFIDRQDNLWICSKNGDLNYLNVNNPFHFWFCDPGNKNQLSKKNITCMLETENQKLWVGFQHGGIDILDLKKNMNKQYIDGHSRGLGENTVLAIYKDRENDIWLGTYMGGLKKYNKNTGHFITYINNPKKSTSLSGNDIRRIAEDSKGNLWFAVNGEGLNKFNKETGHTERFYVNYDNLTSSLINNDWLTTLLCGKDDNIWIGSVDGASLLSTNSYTSKHFKNNPNDTNSLSNNFINVSFEDSEGNIWLGTNNGLNLYRPESNDFKRYSTKDGLCNNYILSIIEDNNKNLWIGTNKGLSMMSIISGEIKNYTKDDGLITDEFYLGACFKNSKGEIYFGGLNGLLVFNPEDIRANSFVPPVYITDFKLFNQSITNKNNDFKIDKPITQCKEITLKYFQNIIGFEFVALNYLNQHKNLYSFKLEGFDKKWSIPGEKREVSYTNLDHGTYIFRVKASNNDGIWNETGASIKIIITPPFWKTYWAKLLYLILIGILLYLFRYLILRDANFKRDLALEKLEIEKLQEMDEQKMRFFSNISHEFRTPLTLIIGPLDKLIRAVKEENYQSDLQIIHRNAKRLLRLINQLMDFRKIEVAGLEVNYVKNDVIKFFTDLSNVFMYEAKQRNISYSINKDVNDLYAFTDLEKMDKILYNLLSNAFKYTPENGRISISVFTIENKIRFTVEDNGCGIPYDDQSKIFQRFYQVEGTSSSGTGIGLALTYELVQLLDGSIHVESEVGKGSVFTVELPFLKHFESPKQRNIDFAKNDTTLPTVHDSIFEAETGPLSTAQALPVLLIVEDNADMRYYIHSEFKDAYRIIEAADGNVGLEKAMEEIPDLIISDIMMPGMDGIEFCKKIKSDERSSHVPIILLTALSSDENAIIGLKSGADDYIIKPFNASILKLKVGNIIESRKLFQSKFVKEPAASIKEIALSAIEEKFLRKAYEVVEQNLSNADLEGKDFAIALGMSRSQVYRKIDALTGQSVKEFIRIIRLKKARELLLSGNKNISEIAFTVGFNSSAYFTRSFSEYYGVPPTRYTESK